MTEEKVRPGRDGERQRLLKRGRWLEIGTLTYNVIEAGVTVTAGLLSGSAALVSFGLDAAVEATSASFLLWRIRGEEKEIGEEALQKRRKWSFSILCIVFTVLAGFILYESISRFVQQKKPEFSIVGVVILCISLVVNPFLAYFKSRTGKQANMLELHMDSREQIICLYMTVAVLAGLLLTRFLGWWWADPAAALLIVPYVLWQAWEAWTGAQDARKDSSHNPRRAAR